ncbi:Hypothetical predicted protein [Paramuricea clavata]|uniref:Uncharacterized protein n=1 Tax=Paramuricea clavata TaxID=317549 RepID=A0A6S7JNL7_PARCT|nr:Hypothetical predicted protein [Paramuricea clavata]
MTDNTEINDIDDLDAPPHKNAERGWNDNAQDIMCEPNQDSASEKIGSTEEKPDVISSTDESRWSLDDFKTKAKESLPDCTNGILSKVNGEKQKKVGQKVSTYRQEEPCIMMASHVFVGELRCLPREPVQISDDRILIKVTCKDEHLDFSLGKNDVTSFKIHSEDDPRIAILTITSDWARKYVERYRQFNTYVDPCNLAYNKKHIVLIFKEVITGTHLETLIQLIDNNLSDEPIVERISQHEANVEGDRIISAFATTLPKSQSSNDGSSQSTNGILSKVNCEKQKKLDRKYLRIGKENRAL